MKTNVVFMINIEHDERSKSQQYQWSIKAWEHYAKKHDAELFVLDQPLADIEYMAPQWYKTFVFELLEQSGIDYDQILYVDSDTMPHPDTPNVFEISERKFCAVQNYGSMDWVCRSLENYSKYVFDGFTFPYWKYFNSGMFIINDDHKQMFSDMINFYKDNRDTLVQIQTQLGVGKDQPVLNFFVQKSGVEYKQLPYEFNMQDLPRFEIIGEDMIFTKFGWIYHFNCGVRPSPGAYLKRTYDYFYGDK